jgi:uncharacterized damage-inducible protein DinB
MTPEQAKAVAQAMVGLWQGELPATIRVLSAVPDAGRDYSPDSRSRTAWQLVTHIATSDLWFISSVIEGQFAFDPAAVKAAEARFNNVADVVAAYESTVPAALDRALGLSGDALAADLDFFGMARRPRAQWIGAAAHHSMHHRGQLSAYLRAMGARVPDIYGPSGDADRIPGSSP